jgi:hypothetical protein
MLQCVMHKCELTAVHKLCLLTVYLGLTRVNTDKVTCHAEIRNVDEHRTHCEVLSNRTDLEATRPTADTEVYRLEVFSLHLFTQRETVMRK